MGVILFKFKLYHIEAWKLVLISLFVLAMNTSLVYANFMRVNLDWGITDFQMNIAIMLLGKGMILSLSVLPMSIMMMEVVPKNIEASMFAFVGAILQISQDCLGEVVGSLVLDFFQITAENMRDYVKALRFKMLAIVISMFLVRILPTRQAIKDLNERMNNDETGVKQLQTEEDIIKSVEEGPPAIY